MRRVAALLLLLAACDPQADASYPGEPLVTFRGQAVSTGPLPPLEAAMLWQSGPPPSIDQLDLATRAPVQAGFPATFTLQIYQPPPQAARRTLLAGEVPFARATAAALPPGIAVVQIGPAAAGGNPSYGVDANHWIIYLLADVPRGSVMEWWLGGTALPAGFHLVRVAAVNPRCITADQLNACMTDLANRGAKDPAAAQSLCLQPFQLSLAPPGDPLILDLGSVGLGPAGGGSCP
jgi:hypothetical protein